MLPGGYAPSVHQDYRDLWTLDRKVDFLNHGSFGACPQVVLDHQASLRGQMEREPVRFFEREAPVLAETAREALGRFVGAPADALALVPNVTVALNAAMRSCALGPGDEVIITDHEYNASKNIAEVVAAERGARVRTARVPFPCAGPGAVVEAVLNEVTPRTRVALIDHVTSQTALIFPVQDIARELHGRGVEVVVDGAHAPGMLPLDIEALGVAFYGGNCHKWMCAPKGAGFLYVRSDFKSRVRAPIVSHGATESATERFRKEFDWMGTLDVTSFLSVPRAIQFLADLPGGVEQVRASNRALSLAARSVLQEALGAGPLPAPDEMLGSMASLPLPAPLLHRYEPAASALELDALHNALFDRYRIDVPVMGCPAHPGRMLRVSAQLYNSLSQYERLGGALRELMGAS